MSLKKIKKLIALGVIYKVVRRKRSSDGVCCPITYKITINPEAKNQQLSILHEGFHSVFFSGGLFEALEGNMKLIEVICEQNARFIDENFILIPREHTLEK